MLGSTVAQGLTLGNLPLPKDLMCCAQTGSVSSAPRALVRRGHRLTHPRHPQGKTCAFLLPVAAAIGGGGGKHQRPGPPGLGRTVPGKPATPRCVILAPTRELALQIALEGEKLCFESPLRSVVVYGGADQKKQVRELAFGCDIVVATPGRLTDFIERDIVSLAAVTFLVLDEADRMLDMGFEPQIRRIVQKADMPPKERRQTMMFR